MLLVEGRGGGGDVSGGLNNVVRSARGGARRQFGNSWFISSLVNALFVTDHNPSDHKYHKQMKKQHKNQKQQKGKRKREEKKYTAPPRKEKEKKRDNKNGPPPPSTEYHCLVCGADDHYTKHCPHGFKKARISPPYNGQCPL
ncbi:hypothetical protein NFJ02_03g101640 [Pycnococcus provasolii]